ncbi:ABC transporter permease [Gluconobacter frateurii]|uniref:ABC transporter permease n=1 Tax=Gluconobacter frateurii TaxID=38308 RepID=UPI001F052796|nr:ABC transporter permease [Gluconobacter frateurii]UMM09168.1 ABC transporter permease [Gluconobacter frateurii]
MASLRLSPLEWSDLRRALGLYFTATFLRSNYMLLMLACWVVAAAVTLWNIHALLRHETLAQALSHANIFNAILVIMLVQSVLQLHANNQIGGSQAPSIPGLALAEARAASIVASVTILGFAGLTSLLPVPFHDALFFVLFNAIPYAVQWYAPPREQSGKKRVAILSFGIALTVGQFALLLVSDAAYWMLTRPAVLTIPVSIILFIGLIGSILSLPNRLHDSKSLSPSAHEQPLPVENTRSGPVEPSAQKPLTPYQLRQMLLAPTAPVTFRTDILISLILIPVFLSVFAMIEAFLSHRSFDAAWVKSAGTGCVMLVIGDKWLLDRQHWPLLLVTGRFGSRLKFVQAVFKAKLSRMLIVTPIRVLSLVVPYAVLKPLLPTTAFYYALDLIVLAVGMTLCSALPFLLLRSPAKSIVFAFNLAPVLLIQLCSPFLLSVRNATYLAITALVLGFLSYLLAPYRISRSDWPYEND